jgi:polyisoprenyl-phosphate glycosyltransferase
MLTLIIPCYNEKDNLYEIIDKCEKLVNTKLIKIILVNNGSTDGSSQILNTIKNDKIYIHHIKKNIGYGNGIMEGLKQTDTQFIGWTHADLQTNLEDVIQVIQILENQKNLFIKGLRKKRNLSSNILTLCMSIIETLIFQKFLWDINAQPTIFSRQLLQEISNPPKNFMLDLYFYVKAKKLKFEIRRFNVFFYKRKFGISNWDYNFSNRVKTIVNAIIYSIHLRIKND